MFIDYCLRDGGDGGGGNGGGIAGLGAWIGFLAAKPKFQVKLENGRPLSRLNELEMVKGYVFANVWFDDNLYKIDPVTGAVVDSYNFSELYPKVRSFRMILFRWGGRTIGYKKRCGIFQHYALWGFVHWSGFWKSW